MADFHREYRLVLPDDLKGLSWRRFRTLLTGLSPRSRWMLMLSRRAPALPPGSTDLFALSAEEQRSYVAAKIRR